MTARTVWPGAETTSDRTRPLQKRQIDCRQQLVAMRREISGGLGKWPEVVNCG